MKMSLFTLLRICLRCVFKLLFQIRNKHFFAIRPVLKRAFIPLYNLAHFMRGIQLTQSMFSLCVIACMFKIFPHFNHFLCNMILFCQHFCVCKNVGLHKPWS